MQAALPIGVFDSGVGGLTVLHALTDLLPSESILYLGDTARVPYGTKSAAVVEAYAIRCAGFLVKQGAKAIVIACNTASAVAVEAIRKEFNIPVVGVIEPGAEIACNATKNGRIGVMGTQGTIQSGAYQKAIERHRPGTTVIGHACPLLVPLAEEDLVDHPAARLLAQDYLKPLLQGNIDTLVLGCTHYPLFKELLQELAGKQIKIVDSAIAVAGAVKTELDTHQLRTQEQATGSRRIFATDWGQRFEQVGSRFLGNPIPEVEHVDL
jgi:glutamate racemase